MVEYRQAVTEAGGRLCIMCQGNVTAAAVASLDAVLDSMIALFCRCESFVGLRHCFLHGAT